MAVCDTKTLSIIDLEKQSVEKHTTGNKDLTHLFKLHVPDESGVPAFAGVTTNGFLKVWNECLLDENGKPLRKDMDPFRLDLLKVLKAGIGEAGGTAGNSEITDMI